MANDLEANIRTALENLTKALADVSKVTIETRYKPIDAQNPNDLDNSFLAARTVIKLDGDHESIIPVASTGSGSIVLETALLDLRLRNVQTAIEYRTHVLNTLVDLFRKGGL